MKWVCIDKGVPEIFDKYLVTLESNFRNERIVVMAEYKPGSGAWNFLDDMEDFEGWRVIAWKEVGRAFDWSDSNE